MSRSDPQAADQKAVRALRNFARALRRDWWLAALATVLAVIGAVFATGRQTPTYESSASLLFQEESGRGRLIGQVDPRQGLQQGSALETDMWVLRSRQIARAVVDSLGLQLRFLDPQLPTSELFSHLAVGRDARAGVYELRRTGAGAFQLVAGPGAPRPVVIGAPVSMEGFAFTLSESLPAQPVERIRFEVQHPDAAADRLRKQLVVARPEARAQLVTVLHRSDDPVMAALVPNVYAQTFIEYRRRTEKTEAQSTVEFLADQVAAYEQRLFDAEERLREFRERDRVVDLEAEATEQVARLAQLQAQRDEVQSELTALNSLLAEAEAGATGPVNPYRQLASFPFFLSNRAVQDLLGSLMTLEDRRAELLVRRTPDNLDVQGIDARVSELETQLYHMARNYRTSLANQVASLNGTLAEFHRELALVPVRELGFARFSREREMLAEMYLLLQQRLKEAEIENAAESGQVRILDPALVPTAPISPRPLVNLLLALVAGLLFSVVVIYLRSIFDRTVRSADDATHAATDIPVLAVVPRIGAPANPTPRGAATSANGRRLHFPVLARRSDAAPPSASESLVMVHDPDSAAAEAFRALRGALHAAAPNRPIQTLVVTSTMPGEGKSTTAANLAVAFADQELRTLLVDADMRRGRLHRFFETPAAPGLREVLDGIAPLAEAIRRAPSAQGPDALHLLAAGTMPEGRRGDRGLRGIADLLARLRKEFDVIVLDAPPIGLFADASILAADADAILLVARIGATQRLPLTQAVQAISGLPAPVRGLVLNDLPRPEPGYPAPAVPGVAIAAR
jgi:capsular exopolysaccharide synthesis family protein